MCEDIWYRDLTGQTYEIGEDDAEQHVEIMEMLTEDLDERTAQMRIYANGRIQETDTKVMVSISIDLKPDDFDIDDFEEHQEDVKLYRALEHDIIDLLFKIGHGPQRIDSCFYQQAETSPRPDGFIYLIAMEQPPGGDVEDTMDDLSDNQLHSIRKQLAYILNELAKIKVTMRGQHPSFLRYDKKNDKLYLVDLTHCWEHDIHEEIGMNSAYVMAFGLWESLVPDGEEYPWKFVKNVEEEKEQKKEQTDDEGDEG